MRPVGLIARFLALFLSLVLALPSPVFALHTQEPAENQEKTGLEERLREKSSRRDFLKVGAASLVAPVIPGILPEAPAQEAGLEEKIQDASRALEDAIRIVPFKDPALFFSMAGAALKAVEKVPSDHWGSLSKAHRALKKEVVAAQERTDEQGAATEVWRSLLKFQKDWRVLPPPAVPVKQPPVKTPLEWEKEKARFIQLRTAVGVDSAHDLETATGLSWSVVSRYEEGKRGLGFEARRTLKGFFEKKTGIPLTLSFQPRPQRLEDWINPLPTAEDRKTLILNEFLGWSYNELVRQANAQREVGDPPLPNETVTPLDQARPGTRRLIRNTLEKALSEELGASIRLDGYLRVATGSAAKTLRSLPNLEARLNWLLDEWLVFSGNGLLQRAGISSHLSVEKSLTQKGHSPDQESIRRELEKGLAERGEALKLDEQLRPTSAGLEEKLRENTPQFAGVPPTLSTSQTSTSTIPPSGRPTIGQAGLEEEELARILAEQIEALVSNLSDSSTPEEVGSAESQVRSLRQKFPLFQSVPMVLKHSYWKALKVVKNYWWNRQEQAYQQKRQEVRAQGALIIQQMEEVAAALNPASDLDHAAKEAEKLYGQILLSGEDELMARASKIYRGIRTRIQRFQKDKIKLEREKGNLERQHERERVALHRERIKNIKKIAFDYLSQRLSEGEIVALSIELTTIGVGLKEGLFSGYQEDLGIFLISPEVMDLLIRKGGTKRGPLLHFGSLLFVTSEEVIPGQREEMRLRLNESAQQLISDFQRYLEGYPLPLKTKPARKQVTKPAPGTEGTGPESPPSAGLEEDLQAATERYLQAHIAFHRQMDRSGATAAELRNARIAFVRALKAESKGDVPQAMARFKQIWDEKLINHLTPFVSYSAEAENIKRAVSQAAGPSAGLGAGLEAPPPAAGLEGENRHVNEVVREIVEAVKKGQVTAVKRPNAPLLTGENLTLQKIEAAAMEVQIGSWLQRQFEGKEVRLLPPVPIRAGLGEMKSLPLGADVLVNHRQSGDIPRDIYRMGTDNIFLIETNTQETLHNIFGRMSFMFVFKTSDGTHRLIRPNELESEMQATSLTRYTATYAYPMKYMARFFTQAAEDLTEGERWLRQMLIQADLLRSVRGRWIASRESVVLGFSQDMEKRNPGARKRLAPHELNHALYFTVPVYQRSLRRIWKGLASEQKEVVNTFLRGFGGYNVGIQKLRDREMAAYFRDEESIREEWESLIQQDSAPAQRLRELITDANGRIRAEWLEWLSDFSRRLRNTADQYWKAAMPESTAGLEATPPATGLEGSFLGILFDTGRVAVDGYTYRKVDGQAATLMDEGETTIIPPARDFTQRLILREALPGAQRTFLVLNQFNPAPVQGIRRLYTQVELGELPPGVSADRVVPLPKDLAQARVILSEMTDQDVLILDKDLIFKEEMVRTLVPFGVKPLAMIRISRQDAASLRGFELENLIREAERIQGRVLTVPSVQEFFDYKIGVLEAA